MSLYARIRGLPLAAKVPILVAGLMLLAAGVMSAGALLRLRQEQDSRIAALSNAYLEATASSLADVFVRRDVWEAFDILDRSRNTFGALRLQLAVAVLPDGSVLAATDARKLPVGSRLQNPTENAPSLLWAGRDVTEGGIQLGRLLIEVDVSEQQAARVHLGAVLVAANAGLAAALALLGWWLVRRMLRPVRLLTDQLALATSFGPSEIPTHAFDHVGPEFGSLFESYNAMVRAAGERASLQAQLAEEERLATLGMLAGSMAHEVNNPLGGMLTALDTIAEHGADQDVREQSVGFVKRGLEDIRNVVRASLVLYKAPTGPATLSRAGLDDLRHLAGPEAARRGVQLAWENLVDEASVGDATAVRQVVLNLLLNAVAASPPRGTVSLTARHAEGRLTIAVTDEGDGLPPRMASMLDEPNLAAPSGNKGLGLWTAIRAARSLHGTIRREVAAIGTVLILEIPTESANAGP